MTSSRSRAVVLALATCGLVVGLDQAVKGLIETQIARGETVEVLPFLSFENTRNTGIAFGLADDVSPLLIGVTIAALVALLGFMATRGEGDTPMWLAAGLLVGGALANLADRVREEAVIDYIDIGPWPTFNFADVAIVAGVAVLILFSARKE